MARTTVVTAFSHVRKPFCLTTSVDPGLGAARIGDDALSMIPALSASKQPLTYPIRDRAVWFRWPIRAAP